MENEEDGGRHTPAKNEDTNTQSGPELRHGGIGEQLGEGTVS